MLHLNTINEATHNLLLSLQEKSYLASFALAGGTNLSLRFGHRKSIDLDMFSTTEFSPQIIDELFYIDYKNAYTLSGNNKYMLFAYINSVKVDCVYHPFALLSPIETIDGIKLFSVADIAAMKLFAVTKRGAKKDFFDIYTLCENLGADIIIDFFKRKYGEDKEWMLRMSLVYFEDADVEEDPIILEKELTWSVVKKFLLHTFAP